MSKFPVKSLKNVLSKPFSYKWQLIPTVLILALAGLLLPVRAEAGFFDIFKKIFAEKNEASEFESSAAAIALPLLGSQAAVSSGIGGPVSAGSETNLPVTQDSALVGDRNPAGTLPPETGQIVVYTVVAGDTPGAIAERFGISLNTLLWANDLKNARSIKTGDTLIILPVSGVRYEIKKGDTVSSVAKKFKPRDENDFDGFVNDILSYNGLNIDDKLGVGEEIIIPDGEVNLPSAAPIRSRGLLSRFANLPEFIGYYIRPILGGRKTQGLHGYNGVDLANSCGQPIMATADGQIIISKSAGWNTGYGQYAAISHANNTQSVYAHMSKVFAKVGQWVSKGETIGLIGSTGRSTGCHLHFEIRGARNPF